MRPEERYPGQGIFLERQDSSRMSQLPRSLLSNSFGIYSQPEVLEFECSKTRRMYSETRPKHERMIYIPMPWTNISDAVQSIVLFIEWAFRSCHGWWGKRGEPKCSRQYYHQAVDTVGRPHEAGLKGRGDNIRNTVSHVTEDGSFNF